MHVPLLNARLTPTGERIATESEAEQSWWYACALSNGPRTSTFDLRVLKKILNQDDVELFQLKVDTCLRRMKMLRALSLWDFAINLRAVDAASSVFVACLESLVFSMRTLRINAYCYGVDPRSELGAVLSRGVCERCILNTGDSAGVRPSDPDYREIDPHHQTTSPVLIDCTPKDSNAGS